MRGADETVLSLKKWGQWIIPFFFAMLPWEISKVLFPPYQSAPETPTTITFARIALVILVAWGALYFIQSGIWKNIQRLFQGPLIWSALPLLAAAGLSYVGSMQPRTTLGEIARLVLLLAVGVSIALGAVDHKTFQRVGSVFFAVATLTAIFGLIQYLTGRWIWGGGINIEGVRRVNSTFIDPNIFARYLDVSILGSLMLMAKKEWSAHPLRVLALLLQIGALGVTFSRTGWLILFVGVLGMAILSHPRKRWGILGGGGVLVLVLMAIPMLRTRLLTLGAGISALGQRQHLLQGGWAMFIEHPLTGVGLGNFQWALEHPYLYLVPWSDAVTRSHTTFVTVLAEMGILGLVAMLLFLVFVTMMNLRVVGRMRGFALAITAGIWVIWLSSQGEGRFFEDPLLWGLWGLSLALQWKHWGDDWDD